MGYRSLGFKAFNCLVAVFSAFLIAGCPSDNGTSTSGGGASSGTSSSTSSGTFGNLGPAVSSSGTVGTDTPTNNGAASFITVTQVVLTNSNPYGQIDLIGENGQIGQNCTPNTNCNCVFSFTDGSGNLLQSQVPLDYSETNLARCTYTSVNAQAGYFDVLIQINAGQLDSNSTRVYVPSLNPQIDPSQSANFLPIWRYMCRDMIPTGASGLNSNYYNGGTTPLVDPRLWDFSYGYNFYTNSLGQDYGATPTSDGTQVPNWECPPVPNDTSDNPAIDYNLYSEGDVDLADPGNLTIANGLGDNTIYPNNDNLNLSPTLCPTGNEPTCEKYILNRLDFYLATFQNGTFKQPVFLIHKVSNRALGTINASLPAMPSGSNVVTLTTVAAAAAASGSPPPDLVGWAAMPDQNEQCPTTAETPIPAGKKWAKLWQFKANFPIRTLPDYGNTADIGALFCADREDTCNTIGYIPGGVTTGPINGPSGGPSGAAGASGIAGIAQHTLWIASVCWNTRNPTGQGLPFVFEPLVASNPSLAGYGNCDQTAAAGDGNGPAMATSNCSPGDYFVDACASLTGTPGCNGAPIAVCGNAAQIPCADCNPKQIATGSACLAKDGSGNLWANCCQDTGAPSPPQSGQFSGPSGSFQLPANFAPNGGQWCNPALIGSHDSSSANMVGTIKYLDPLNATSTGDTTTSTIHPGGDSAPIGQDIWLLGNGNVKACIEADTDANGNLYSKFQNFPPSPDPFSPTTDQLDATNQQDIVYVVTPTTVMLADMETVNGTVAQKYTPYRVFAGNDASSRVVYSLYSGAQSTGVAAQRLSSYPLCVLQDSQEGAVTIYSGGSP